MAASDRRDMTINGAGTVPAGTYETVTINGGGTVSGDLACTALRINGAATVDGAIKAASVTVNGSATFASTVQASEISVIGDAGVRGGLGAGRLNIRGSLRVDGGVAARDIDVRGMLRTPSSIETGTLTGEASLQAAKIKAETIDVVVYGTSDVNSVEATRIVVKSPGSFAEIVALFKANEFRAERMRASELWLENSVVSLVSGGNVTVGSGCRIGLVHYSGTLIRQGNAQISEERKA